MKKTINFKGRIEFFQSLSKQKAGHLEYGAPNFSKDFENGIANTMMADFEQLNLTSEEKKNLSRSHREILNYYRYLSPFSLNTDAKKLIAEINHSSEKQLTIKAEQYGAYVCLAALYSGKLDRSKKIDFILEKAPIALFPKSFMKSRSKSNNHKVVFCLTDDCWLSPFNSLYNNHNIKLMLKKAA